MRELRVELLQVASGGGHVVFIKHSRKEKKNDNNHNKHTHNKASPSVGPARRRLDPPSQRAERSSSGLALCLFKLLRQFVCLLERDWFLLYTVCWSEHSSRSLCAFEQIIKQQVSAIKKL